MVEYCIEPMGAPRMTRRDTWKKRPVVMRYFAYRDQIRLNKIEVPESGAHIKFIISMPKSWSEKKKSQMDGEPHKCKPDSDNLCKGLLDAIYRDDAHIWDIHITKYWGRQGKIIVNI